MISQNGNLTSLKIDKPSVYESLFNWKTLEGSMVKDGSRKAY
jgi:hypothetical protein